MQAARFDQDLINALIVCTESAQRSVVAQCVILKSRTLPLESLPHVNHAGNKLEVHLMRQSDATCYAIMLIQGSCQCTENFVMHFTQCRH